MNPRDTDCPVPQGYRGELTKEASDLVYLVHKLDDAVGEYIMENTTTSDMPLGLSELLEKACADPENLDWLLTEGYYLKHEPSDPRKGMKFQKFKEKVLAYIKEEQETIASVNKIAGFIDRTKVKTTEKKVRKFMNIKSIRWWKVWLWPYYYQRLIHLEVERNKSILMESDDNWGNPTTERFGKDGSDE